MPRIAQWYQDKKAAVSLRFDDNFDSHVRTVIPLLNQFGIRATFMVNPGTRSFKRNGAFWTSDAVEMGHALGNHTMHHRGAWTLKAAEYEIGEATRQIRELYPDSSPLMAFASGGGEKWGGKDWEDTSQGFRSLVEKYDLIDLYDGTHPSFSASSGLTAQDFIRRIERAVNDGSHQAFTFHDIGNPGWKDLLRSLLGGYNLCLPEEEFRGILEGLASRGNDLWVAPVIDIIKYERERTQAQIEVLERGRKEIHLRLHVGTDPRLYDHPLSIILEHPGWKNVSASQNEWSTSVKIEDNSNLIIEGRPFNSEIVVKGDPQ